MLAAPLFGVQLLGAHLHLDSSHDDHRGGHVHSVYSGCHTTLDHADDGVEVSLWQALFCKLSDGHESGAAVLMWLIAPPTAIKQHLAHSPHHSPPRLHWRAHARPLLRAPPR